MQLTTLHTASYCPFLDHVAWLMERVLEVEFTVVERLSEAWLGRCGRCGSYLVLLQPIASGVWISCVLDSLSYISKSNDKQPHALEFDVRIGLSQRYTGVIPIDYPFSVRFLSWLRANKSIVEMNATPLKVWVLEACPRRLLLACFKSRYRLTRRRDNLWAAGHGFHLGGSCQFQEARMFIFAF